MSSRFHDVARYASMAMLLVALTLGGCEREQRKFEPSGPDAEALEKNVASAMVDQ